MMPDSELAAVVILVFLGLIIALLAIFYRMKYNSRKEVQTPWDWMFEQTRIQQKKNTKFAALRKRQEIQEIWGNKQNPGRRMTSEELSEAKRTRIYNLPENVERRRLEAEERIREEKDLAKQIELEERRRIKNEKKSSKRKIVVNQKKQLKKSVELDAVTENIKIVPSKFSEFIKKITKKNTLRPYPDINDIPN